jgi:aspartate/methionine/tyrosine aminotransferase
VISNRVQGFTESVIREMTRVVSPLGGVNLAQGMPNFRPPQELIDAAHRAIDGDFHQYAITWGTPGLRAAIADKYRVVYGMDVDPERHVTVSAARMKAAGIQDDYAFAMYLIKEVGVATVPGSSFYAHTELGRTKIRFCFPKTDDMLREAGERLQKLRALV